MFIGVALNNKHSSYSIEDLFNVELECNIIHDEFNDKFKEIDQTLMLLDNVLQLQKVRNTYRGYEAQSVLHDLFGNQLSYSYEGTIADIWERIKQFCAWIWNGIKKLFGVADKKISTIKESIKKKRDKAKDDNLGKTVTVRIVNKNAYQSAVKMIADMIDGMKRGLDNDFKDVNLDQGDESFEAKVNSIRSLMDKKVTHNLSKWSEVDSLISGAQDRERNMMALGEQLSTIVKKLQDIVNTNKQDNGSEAKVKMASALTRLIKSVMKSINGVTQITISDVAILARGGMTETDKADVATGGEKK